LQIGIEPEGGKVDSQYCSSTNVIKRNYKKLK
jgi:hypothetical protein